MEWEVRLIEWLQRDLNIFTAIFGKVFSFIGGEKGLLLVLLAVLFCWKKEVGKRLALVVTAVNAWGSMIKAVVLRPRPYMAYPDRVKALELVDTSADAADIAAQGYSFPSSHAASAASLYISLAREIKKKWMWAAAVAISLLVGVCRVAVGMHYPTDVLAGWAVGLMGIAVCALLDRIKNAWIRHLILLLSLLPGVFYVRTEDFYTSLGMMTGLIAAIHFEERFVHFQDTRNILAMALRLLFALAVYFALNTLLKLPFDKAFLDSGTLAALLVRAARYAVDIFVIIGVYPKVFPVFERLR